LSETLFTKPGTFTVEFAIGGGTTEKAKSVINNVSENTINCLDTQKKERKKEKKEIKGERNTKTLRNKEILKIPPSITTTVESLSLD